jgi:uncharacterized protein (DUF885 family)
MDRTRTMTGCACRCKNAGVSVEQNGRVVRDFADAYVTALAQLDPQVATVVGLRPGEDRLQELSPAGQQARDDLARSTLARLNSLTAATAPDNPDERRCARLLTERLATELAISESGDHLRAVRNLLGPVQGVRMVFTMMPTATAEDWAVIARRMARVPDALGGHIASLREGMRRGLFAAPRQVATLVDQLREWIAAGAGRGWFAEFAAEADVAPPLRTELDIAASAAINAVAELADWLVVEYLPRAEGTPDAVGRERYQLLARQWLGAEPDLDEAYEWGWAQYWRLTADMREQAHRVLPGASVAEAMRHLDTNGEAIEGTERIRLHLQRLIDQRMAELDGTHFDLAEPVKVLQARIAPAGSAAAPYYIRPTRDFSRPGRTYLPTLGRTRFPLWKLVSTWHHEGVPGHHLQFGQWALLWRRLSMYQTGVGSVSATSEGWALYAERLMDELGYLDDPGARLGYLEAQLRRAIRVIIDIGMHLRLAVPSNAPVGGGEIWTPELAREFFARHTAREAAFVDSEIVRYLGVPGQAISYKLGERAWIAGREAARRARGAEFDLKSWHMAALSLGSLGLADLADELATL